ncbi:MAG: cytochrome P450 [Polyangiaceae bacterium]
MNFDKATREIPGTGTSLPPGPNAEASSQTLRWLARPFDFLRECAAQFGDAFTLDFGHHGTYVMFSAPDAVRTIFTADVATLHAGEGNAVLRPVLGRGSLLLLEEGRHHRERRLLMPSFHAKRVEGYGGLVQEAADRALSRFVPGAQVVLQSVMQDISLDVILSAVFGLRGEARTDDLAQRILDFLNDGRVNLANLDQLREDVDAEAWRAVRGRLGGIDEALYEEIARRKASPPRAESDVLSVLLSARHEDGASLDAASIRDQLVTLLITGYETTATALAWALHWIYSDAEVLRRLREDLASLGPAPSPRVIAEDVPYLRAVCNEALRITPILPVVARRVQKPIVVQGYELPTGVTVSACVYLAHHRSEVFPEPNRFWPDRFLGREYSPYEYLPFGGGSRRCLGMTLALFEMKLVLASIVVRCDFEPVGPPVRPARRSVTIGPSGGATMRVVALHVGVREALEVRHRHPLPIEAAEAPESPALGEDEHRTVADLAGLSRSQLLLDRLTSWAQLAPQRVCLERIDVASDGELRATPFTLTELLSGARRAATRLAYLGIGAGDRVLLCLPNTEAFVFWFLGLHWLGAVPVPLPPIGGFSGKGALFERLCGVLDDCAPRALVGDAGTLTAIASRAGFDTGRCILIASDVPGTDDARARYPLEAAGTAFIQYTSGSTGTPRGVLVTHGNLRDNLHAIDRRAKFVVDARHLTWLPLYHDMGLIGGLLVSLFCGHTALLMSPLAFMVRPARWLNAASRFRATSLMGPNFAYALCLHKVRDKEIEGLDLRSVQIALNGSEPIDPATVSGFCARYERYGLASGAHLPVYGLAESALAVSFPYANEPIHIDHVDRVALSQGVAQPTRLAPGVASFVSVGHAMPEHEVEIRAADTGERMPERRLGEIVVRGPSVTPGYFSLSGPVDAPRDGWLHTGDLGYLADGRLYVVDRLKDLVILAGRNFAPSDIERAATVDGVRAGRAVAFGIRSPGEGTDELVLVVEVAGVKAVQADALRRTIRGAVLAEHGIAVREVLLARSGSLPRTSSGKLMRRRSRDLFLAGAITPIEKECGAEDVLPLEPAREDGIGHQERSPS